MKYLNIFILLSLTILLVGCNNNMLLKEYNSSDTITLKESNFLINHTEGLKSPEMQATEENSTSFTFVTSFEPTERFKESMNLLDDQFHFLVNANNEDKIEGVFSIENLSDKDIDVTLIVLQGNKNANIRVDDIHNEWKSAINIKSKSKTVLEVPLQIKWLADREEELIIFPLIRDMEAHRYSGGNLGMTRTLLLKDKNVLLSDENINDQSFQLSKDISFDNISFVPQLYWVGNDLEELKYVIQDELRYTTDHINGLKFSPVPYNSEYDVLLIDEYGNSTLLKEQIKIKKDTHTFVELSKGTIEELYDNKQRQFIVVMNNRGIRILEDAKALNLGKKPFLTSFIGIIEVYKPIENTD